MSIATKALTSSQSSSGELTEQRLGDLAFTYLLDQHPRRLTVDQLGHEIGSDDRPALERAIASLDEACLLSHRDGELIPSPAAVRVDCAAF
ncbi:MAG TPA: hypothetical protein VLL27_07610 [Solirubrobacterales bacterium]|nr:hypothetical protein [Solirubrobacterales bacterium]